VVSGQRHLVLCGSVAWCCVAVLFDQSHAEMHKDETHKDEGIAADPSLDYA
jgi:hypothetical protein